MKGGRADLVPDVQKALAQRLVVNIRAHFLAALLLEKQRDPCGVRMAVALPHAMKGIAIGFFTAQRRGLDAG